MLLLLFGQMILSMKAEESENGQLSKDFLSLRNFHRSKAIDEVLFYNWTENHECLIELNAIKNGLDNYEEWAARSKFIS